NYKFTNLLSGTLTLRPRSTADNVLTLSLDQNSVVEGVTVTATIARNWVSTEPLVVSLSYSRLYPQDPQLNIPLTVTIPADHSSASFPIAAIDNGLVDGTRSVVLTASAADYTDSQAALTVLDDDVPTLRLVLDTSTVAEGGPVTGRVERNWITAAP